MEFHCVEMGTFVDSAIIEPTIGINDVAHRVNCRRMNYLRRKKKYNSDDITIQNKWTFSLASVAISNLKIHI